MSNLLTQEQVEQQMFNGGIKRAEHMMQKAEGAGRAVQNPYSKEILDEYVLPIAAAVRSELDLKRAGKRLAHAALLAGLDEDAVAFLAVRAGINEILTEGISQHRKTAYQIGRTIHSELVLQQIEEHAPELYHTLATDFGRRLSKDERHRMTVFKMQATQRGINVVEWPIGARDQVGLYLLGLMEATGMIEIGPALMKHNKILPREVSLSPRLMERIDQVKAYVAVTMPVYGPCVAPPVDWTTPNDGGFHTKEMRRASPTLVKHRLARTPFYREAKMPIVLDAVNALQQTRWKVNEQMLDIVLKCAEHFSVGEITSLNSLPRPEAPAWLAAEGKQSIEAHPERKPEFVKWKHEMADWYTERKLLSTKYGRFYSATRGAEMFREYPALHFVYFADSRGRLYPMTYGLNPQGSDLQRSLLQFADGLPLDTPDAVKWFLIQGANKWGFDKATLKERAEWHTDKRDLLCSFADNPIDNRGWTDASDPLQFLAWCLEYSMWCGSMANPTSGTPTMLSRLPISMDGSCNGLQNLSALLRDEIGGAATNLTATPKMQDVYQQVADLAYAKLKASTLPDPTDEALRQKWERHGIKRAVVKRSVMTTPYGVTRRSAADYVKDDYLKTKAAPEFLDLEYRKAASVLMYFVWPAIGGVVVKGRETMDWLRRSARVITKSLDPDDPYISWVSPSGFPAAQAYFDIQVHRINSRLHGPCKIRVHSEVDTADVNRHASGLAPNFVHSMDASHLHLTTARAKALSIDALAMIHDDYGTHAAKAELLFRIIREEFVKMYLDNDPISDFRAKYPMIPAPPSKGSLDITEVLKSDYFFS